MKTLIVTPSQIQNFIYLLDGAPALLLDFYLENYDKVFEKKVLPVLDSIWSAIITISIEILENRQEAEEERKEAEPQGFNSKGSKLLN